MMLTDLDETLRAAGLVVIEEPGWRTRGHGQMADVLGVTCHHTANGGAPGVEPSRRVVRDGRPGLEGPLAHLLLRTDGAFRVIAAGLCWHAGDSRERSQTNSHRIGIEAEAEGVPGAEGDWPEVQMNAYAIGCKALMRRYRFDLDEVLGHKETCDPPGRKSDPSFSMARFRQRVLKASAVPIKPQLPEEIDMAQTPITSPEIDRIWNEPNEAILKQTPAGALKTTLDRTAAANLQLQAKLGSDKALLDALADPDHALTVWLTRIETKIDALTPPETPA